MSCTPFLGENENIAACSSSLQQPMQHCLCSVMLECSSVVCFVCSCTLGGIHAGSGACTSNGEAAFGGGIHGCVSPASSPLTWCKPLHTSPFQIWETPNDLCVVLQASVDIPRA